MEHVETWNEVEVTGKLISIKEYRGKQKLISLYINDHSYPQFLCPKDIFPSNLTERMKVSVQGYVTNVPYKDGGQTKHRQRFIATKVEQAKTMTELKFGVKGKFTCDNIARVFLKGSLTSIKEDGEYFRYQIYVGKQVIMVSMKKLERHLPLKEGDQVCCVCVISTTEKGEGDQKKRFENLLVTDLGLI